MKFYKRVYKKVVSFDMFPSPVSLTHKKDSSFTSFIGGVYSITVFLLMLAVTGILLDKLYSKTIQRTTLSKTFFNTFDNKEPKYFMENGPTFMFLLKHHYYSTGNILKKELGRFLITRETSYVDENGNDQYIIEEIPSEECDITDIIKQYGTVFWEEQGFPI